MGYSYRTKAQRAATAKLRAAKIIRDREKALAKENGKQPDRQIGKTDSKQDDCAHRESLLSVQEKVQISGQEKTLSTGQEKSLSPAKIKLRA